MFFMTIFTYEPSNRTEVLRRRMEQGDMVPAGMTVHAEFSAIGGGKVFRIVEVDDEKLALQAVTAWADLGHIEIIPVINTEEAMKLLKGA